MNASSAPADRPSVRRSRRARASRPRTGLARPLARALTPLLLLALLAPAAAGAQQPGPDAADARSFSRLSGSLSFLNTQPVGQLTTGPGWGITATGEYALDPRGIVRLHGVFRGAIYDYESREVCFSQTVGCRIMLDLDTNYSLAYFGFGPQLVVPLGPVAAAMDATLGWGGFFASSSLSGIDEENNSFGSTTNHQDGGFSWAAGGELRVPVARQAALTFGARYQHNGRMSYVRQGDITDNPDGSIGVAERTSEANFVALTIGLSFRPLIGGNDPSHLDP